MKVISYEDWRAEVKAKHDREEQPEEDNTCDECDGDGYLECDLGHEHECKECDGLGSLTPGPSLSKSDYFKAVAEDLQALLDWCGKIPEQINGGPNLTMVVYSDIKTRKLRIVA